VAKNKDPYKNIQRRFIEARAEDKGWEELTVDQRQRLANRFDVLAQTVEGRGKIARTVLPPDVDPTRRREFRQRIKKNLPTKSNNTTTQSNIDTPQANDVNKGIPAPWNAPNLNYRPGNYVPPTRQTTTQSTSRANVNRSALGKVADFSARAGDAIAKFTDPVFDRAFPLTYETRQEKIAKYGVDSRTGLPRNRAQDAGIIPSLKDIQNIAVESALMIGPVAAVGGKTLGVFRKIKGLGKGRDLARFTGLPQTQRTTGAARVAEGVRQATNETRPVASTTERVVASAPEVRQATTATETASTPRLSGEPKKRRSSKPTNVTTVSEPATASPVKAPEVAPSNPVRVEGTQPPTEFQKGVSPAEFTEPAAIVQPAPAATPPAAAPKPKRAKRTKKNQTTVDTSVDRPWNEKTVDASPVESAKGSPASKGVVGGATPKATEKSLSLEPTRSSPSDSGSSKKSPTPVEMSTGQSPPAVEQRPTPTVAAPKSGRKKSRGSSTQTSSTEPKFVPTKEQKKESARTNTGTPGTFQTPRELKVLREAPIERVEVVINPTTGQPVINPRTGQPATRTVYKSDAAIRAEQEAARKARRAERMAEKQTVVERMPGDVGVTQPAKQETQVFDNEGNLLGIDQNPIETPKFLEDRATTDARKKQLKDYEEATGREMRGEVTRFETGSQLPVGGQYVPRRRTLAKRRRAREMTRAETSELRAQLRTTPEEAAKDPRSLEAIQEAVQSQRSLNREILPPVLSKKDQKYVAKNAQLNAEAAARQRSPEVIKQENLAAAAETRRVQAAKIAQDQAIQVFKRGKTGAEVRLRTGKARQDLRAMERRARNRKYKTDDPTQPLHAFMAPEDLATKGQQTINKKKYSEVIDEEGRSRNTYDPFSETVGALDEAGTNLNPRRSYVADPDASFVVSTPEPVKGERFIEYNPRKMDYEQLLDIESAVKKIDPYYEFQIRRDLSTVRYSKDRGLRGGFALTGGKTMSPEQYRALLKSSEFSRQDLIRLIKSTTGKK